MAERGRKPGFRLTDEHRAKIQNSNILNALIEHIQGAREMSQTQVTAGIALLRKVMPDLAAVTVSGDEDNPLVYKEAAKDEFFSRINSLAVRSGVNGGDRTIN